MKIPEPTSPLPKLADLKAKKDEAWEVVYDWLWAIAWNICQRRLGRSFPADVEDVAGESLKEVVKQVGNLKRVEDLPRFTNVIANNRAIMHWREQTAKKRGEGKIVSSDKPFDDGGKRPEPAAESPRLDKCDLNDIRNILRTLGETAKTEYLQAMYDFIGDDLTYEEISKKRGWATGTVGVYIRRGLDAMRKTRKANEKLMDEAKNYFRLLFA